MDELSAAIEAAAAAAAATSEGPPKSPEIKTEIKPEPPSPEIVPPSPLKRARSPIEDTPAGDEKRQKLGCEEIPARPDVPPQPEAVMETTPENESGAASKTTPAVVEEHVVETVQGSVPVAEPEAEPPSGQEIMPDSDHMMDLGDAMADLDEITKMIQAAQEATMRTDPAPEDHPMSDYHADINGTNGDQMHDIDIGSIMASITNGLENGGGGENHDDLLGHDESNSSLHLPDLSSSLPIAPKRTTIWSNRAQYTRQTYVLPTLGKVAVDILIALSDQPLEDTITALNDPDNSSVGKEYGLLRSFFDSLRKQLSEDFPLLYSEQLDIASSEDREIIRIANLATSCASMFGANELGWPDLNASFVNTFVASGQQMAAEEAELYLGLKTQMFLTLLESEQSKPTAQILEELFVSGQEDSLKKHHPDLPLAHSETRFLADAAARKAMLLNESNDANSILALSQQYTYEAFLDELSTYLDRHMANIERLGSSPTSVSANAESGGLFDGVNGLDNFDIDAAIAEAARAAQEAGASNGVSASVPDDLAALISFASEQAQGQSRPNELPSTVLSTSESAMRTTNLALQTMQRNQYHPTTVQQTTNTTTNGQSTPNQPQQQQQQQAQQQQQQQQPQQQQHQQPHQQPPAPQQQYYAYPQQVNALAPQPQTSDRVELPPGQHASSEILYERARQAAAARSSTHARREGSHSTRRPWSPEEEKALMMGLDMVKGPHWSQILSLFGQQGRISNILADRTQVQLKDKARNLKLFFLKTNSEMPYYLQCVTGELKTRAPTQAARKEAEERARLTSDPDDQARISATIALGSLHNSNSQRPQPKPAPTKSGTPGQTAINGHSHSGSPSTSQLQRSVSGHVLNQSASQAGGPISQSGHLAHSGQTAQKPPLSNQQQQQQQHTSHVQHVAPRPTQPLQGHVPLKPHQAQPALQTQNPQQSNVHSHQRQAAPLQHQAPGHQQLPPKPIQPQPQQHSQQQQQQQHRPQAQHSHIQIPQSASHQQPSVTTSLAPAQSKPEDHSIKHEPLNEEEAGLLELKRFMSQETNAEAQEQSIEAALAAASAAAAAVAGPSGP